MNAPKLRVKDRQRLERILYDVKRGLAFIQDERTAIMRASSLTSADVFTAPFYPGARFSSVAKDIGSDLVGVYEAKRRLEEFLTEQDTTEAQS